MVRAGLILLLATIGPLLAFAQQPAPKERCANCGTVGPHYVTALVPTLACPVLRNLIFFYQSALNLADQDMIDAFVKGHDCMILHRNEKYLLNGWGAAVSGITVGTTPMYVRTDAILGE